MTQGACNGGDRGSVSDRRRRKAWLVRTFAADVGAVVVTVEPMQLMHVLKEGSHHAQYFLTAKPNWCRVAEACRCYRCGRLLVEETVTADRIVPGIDGGTYVRNNIRPACSRCQSITGNQIKAERRARALARAQKRKAPK